mgnify:CR=1 FL=1
MDFASSLACKTSAAAAALSFSIASAVLFLVSASSASQRLFFLAISSKEKSDEENIEELMNKHLTGEQVQSVKNFMKDEQKMKKLLSSPLAKAFIQKYLKNGE